LKGCAQDNRTFRFTREVVTGAGYSGLIAVIALRYEFSSHSATTSV